MVMKNVFCPHETTDVTPTSVMNRFSFESAKIGKPYRDCEVTLIHWNAIKCNGMNLVTGLITS